MYIILIQVPLGIYLKGEQKYEEMIEVLDHLHQYVPTVSEEEEVETSDGKAETTFKDTFYSVGLGKLELICNAPDLMLPLFLRW